jgi:hypothetical protein
MAADPPQLDQPGVIDGLVLARRPTAGPRTSAVARRREPVISRLRQLAGRLSRSFVAAAVALLVVVVVGIGRQLGRAS